jgi:hypothetical protein
MSAAEQFESSLKKGRGRAQRSVDLIEAMYAIAFTAQPITGRGIGYKLFTQSLIPSMGRAQPMKQRLPNRRGSIRFAIRHDGATYLATLSRFEDGRLAEIFLDALKPDSQLAIHASDSAILASILLQHGVTAAAIRHSIAGPLATALAQAEEGEDG